MGYKSGEGSWLVLDQALDRDIAEPCGHAASALCSTLTPNKCAINFWVLILRNGKKFAICT